jgi:hypothetical protein
MRVVGECVLVLMIVSASGPAQTVHHATPSERFPASWYPADNNVTYTETPVTGAPYEARRVTDGQSGSGMRVARDSAGRVHEEEPQPRLRPDGSLVQAREVSVEDPVSHCRFQWMEPWAASGPPTATVQCMPPTLHYNGQPPWAKAMASAAGEKPPAAPGDTVRNEALGEREFGGVRASGLRSTTTASDTGGAPGPAQTSTVEIWWSSELKEIVAMHSSIGYGTELRAIVRQEPDAALFYPPAGYRIQVLGTTP